MKKYFLIRFLFSIVLLAFLLLPNVSLVAKVDLNLKYPSFMGIDLDTEEGQNLNALVAWFYYFIVSIAGIAAFFMLVWGGFEWLSSAGSPAKIAEARDKISSALIGLLLILASYLILQVINPELVILKGF